ncbi:hypothetical protein GCM10027442_38320 [Emticicia fontis]
MALLLMMLSVDSPGQEPYLIKNINQSSQFSNKLIDVNGVLYFTKENEDTTIELWKANASPQGSATFIKTISYYTSSEYQLHFAVIGNTLYFNVLNYPGGGLWKTDGTVAGTQQLKEVSTIQELMVINQTLYFGASLFNGQELWKSDGTESGTVPVKDIWPGSQNSLPKNLTNVNGVLYFSADDGTHGRELWKSDGTEAGTVLVKDVRVGSASGIEDFPGFCAAGTKLFFLANAGTSGNDLWVSDGTAVNTVLVKDFAYIREELHARNNSVLFSAYVNGINSEELWISDGTLAGTVQVKEIAPSTYAGSYPTNFITAGAYTFFSVTNDPTSANGEALWRTDGTEAGTLRVTDIRRSNPGQSFNKGVMGTDGTRLFFSNYDPVNGDEVRMTTGVGSTLLKDIRPGGDDALPQNYTRVGNLVYFEAHANEGLRRVFRTDGTLAGTTQALNDAIYQKDLGSVEIFGNLYDNINMIDMGSGNLFFTAQNMYGVCLYKTTGTTASTVKLKCFDPYYTHPRRFANMNGTLYFAATEREKGEELWKSDGTPEGTVMVKDIYEGSTGGTPNFMTWANGSVYFIATHPYSGRELWKTDGTSQGTVLVKDIYPGSYYTDNTIPINLTEMNGLLYFMAADATLGRELWKSDGTEAGTTLVKDVNPGSAIGFYSNSYMINGGGTLYFSGYSDANGFELWKSDGSTAGTVLVKDIVPGTGSGLNEYSSGGCYFTWINGTLYFQGITTENGEELWKSDGTSAGTVMVKDIATGSRGSGPNNLVENNGVLYFAAYDELTDRSQLFKSDGTSAGTVRVKDIPGSSGPYYMTAAQGKVYFAVAATDFDRVFRLWESDGTEAGTIEISDSLTLRNLAAFLGNDQGVFINTHYKKVLIPSGDRLYFFADNGSLGPELWAFYRPPCATNLTMVSPTDDILAGLVAKEANAATGSIKASNKISGAGTKVSYKARKIELLPSFKADTGVVFKAEIGGCN